MRNWRVSRTESPGWKLKGLVDQALRGRHSGSIGRERHIPGGSAGELCLGSASARRPEPIVENSEYRSERDVPRNRLPERRPVEVAVDVTQADRRVGILEQGDGVENHVFDVGKDDAL